MVVLVVQSIRRVELMICAVHGGVCGEDGCSWVRVCGVMQVWIESNCFLRALQRGGMVGGERKKVSRWES